MNMLDGNVVLVTGGAGGIGRACALLAAREGARVVVNDLGTGLGGGSADSQPGQAVVDEIRAGGGEAVFHGGSVASLKDCEDMVALALDSFGGLHSVINPVGILRDTMFHKMTEADWDAVIAVHLRGAFNVARATVNHFRGQNGGAYVHFTSTSGLIGNLAQSNYAAAKMGIVGLSRILAMEGALKNVRSNVIAPFAWTRMIASIPVTDEASAQRVERFKNATRADQVAPLAIALAASAQDGPNGQIFGSRGNEVFLFSQPRPIRSMAASDGWSPQSILDTVMPAMAHDFADLVPSASIFPYDPL